MVAIDNSDEEHIAGQCNDEQWDVDDNENNIGHLVITVKIWGQVLRRHVGPKGTCIQSYI